MACKVKPHLLFVLPVLLWAGMAGCRTTPSGPRVYRAESPYLEQVNQQVGIYDDETIIDYLDAIKARLLQGYNQDPREIDIYLIDNPMPNAYAAPDKTIFISRGMLSLASTEDDIAAVIAHELVHILNKHHVKQSRRRILPGLLSLPGKAVGKVVNEDIGNLVNAPIEGIGMLYLADYSRDQEEEADIDGVGMLAKAGYDPRSMARILEQLEETSTLLRGEYATPSFYDTHPSTPDRIVNIYAEIVKLEKAENQAFPGPGEVNAYLSLVDGMIFGVNPAQGVFEESRFIHPDLNFSLQFPKDWTPFNTPMAAGALSPKGDGALFIGNAGYGPDPDPYARRLRQSFYDEFGIHPIKEEIINLEGNEAYILAYRDRSSEIPAIIYFLWVSHDGRVYQLIGLCKDQGTQEIESSLMSFRPLRLEERESITVLRIRKAEALPGETLHQLSQRTANRWTDRVTSIANRVEENHRFAGGEILKIVKEEPYWDSVEL